MEELKPCPFCGDEAGAVSEYDIANGGSVYYIECKKCHAKTSKYLAAKYASEAWNRRNENGCSC